MEIEKIEKPSENLWHENIKCKVNKSSFNVTTNLSGCGSMIISEWRNCKSYEDSIFLLKQLIEMIQNGGSLNNDLHFSSPLDIGCLITTVGETYYGDHFENALIESGFECVKKYINPRHGHNYTQKLYIWTID